MYSGTIRDCLLVNKSFCLDAAAFPKYYTRSSVFAFLFCSRIFGSFERCTLGAQICDAARTEKCSVAISFFNFPASSLEHRFSNRYGFFFSICQSTSSFREIFLFHFSSDILVVDLFDNLINEYIEKRCDEPK